MEEVAPLLRPMCRETETLAPVMTRRRKWHREDQRSIVMERPLTYSSSLGRMGCFPPVDLPLAQRLLMGRRSRLLQSVRPLLKGVACGPVGSRGPNQGHPGVLAGTVESTGVDSAPLAD